MQELISKLSASTEKIGLADFEKIISYGRRSIPMSPIMSRSRAPGGSMSPTMSRSRAPGGSMSPATAVMRSTRRETMSPTSTLRGTRRRSMTPVAFPPPAKLELPAGWVLSDRDSLKDQLIRAFNNFIEKTQKSWEQENLNMMKTKLAKMKGDPAVKVLLDDLKDKKITTVDDFDKRFYDLNIVTKTQSRTPGQTDMFIRMVKNLIAEMPKIKKEYSSVEKLVCIHEMLMKLDAFYSSVGDIAKGYLDVEPDKIPKEVKDFLASFQLGKSFREIETYCIGITNELRRLRSHFEMAARNYSRSLDRSSHRAVTFSTVGEIIEECVGKFDQWCREGINVFGEDLQKSISNLDGMSVSKKDMIEFANIFKGIYSSNIIVLKDAVKNYCRIVDGELVSKIKELKQLSREISPTNSQVAPEVQKMEQYVKCWHDLNTQLSSVENTQGALELSVWEDFYKWLLEVIHQDRATSPFSSALDGVQSRLGGFEALAYAQLVMRVPMVLDEALKHSKGYLEELKEYSPKNLSVAVPDDQVKILQDFINEFDDKVLTQKQKSDLIEKCKTSKSIRSLLRAIEELRRYFVVDGLLQDVSTIAMDLSKPTDLSEVGEIQSKVEGFIDKVKRFKTKGERLAQDFQHIQDSGQTKEFLNKVLVWLTLYAKK